MQALGDHLGADEDVDRAGLEAVERLAVAPLARHRVGVHPLDAGLCENAPHGLLDLLRAHARVADAGVPAFRALRRSALGVPADVAANPLVVAMVGQRDAAIRAMADVPAHVAKQRRRVAAPVEKKYRLLPGRQPPLDGGAEHGREDRALAAPAILLPHVHDAHERHFAVVDAIGQRDEAVFRADNVVVALERGRGAAEHNRARLHAGAQHCEIPAMITRRLLLFV